jgi:zinc finger CCHC domain-containing protein 9
MKYILTSKPSILAFRVLVLPDGSEFQQYLRSVIAMTRVTNFGIKRTHLEAGFSNNETPSKETAIGGRSSVGINDPTASSEAPPPKKKRKRTPKSKRDGNLAKYAAEKKDETRENDSLKEDDSAENGATAPATTGKSAKRNKRNKERRNKGKSSHSLLYT